MMVLGNVAFATENDGDGSTGESSTPAATYNSSSYANLAVTSTSSTLTIKNTGKTAHTFELYQIFKGDVDSTGVLSNIVWGSGITEAGKTALGTAATKAGTISGEAGAKAFADVLMGGNGETSYLTGATPSTAVAANGEYTFSGLNPGYYLVIDEAGSQDGKESAYTAYIMYVVGTVKQETKLDIPTVEKKVKDKDDTAGSTTGWQDSADYDIGDSIPYQITGTLPSNFDEYETYTTYTFTDTLSKGLTAPAEADITIKMNGTKDIKDNFDISIEGKVITISLKETADLKDIADTGDTIVVEYSAVLNSDAKIGAEGNENTVNLEYSNNPNYGGDGDTGTTPDDKVIVFTYKTVVNKVDEDENTLVGANFALYKAVAGTTTTTHDDEQDEDVTTTTYPDGAVKGSDLKTTITTTTPSAEVSALQDNTYYIEIGTHSVGEKTGDTEGSQFTFNGIDDGTYVLVETVIPAGYNAYSSVTVTVSAEHEEESTDPQLTSLTIADPFEDETVDNGTGTATIKNEKGGTLPSTGGIGTTIFYVAGSILVLAAAILLITKRRMGADE